MGRRLLGVVITAVALGMALVLVVQLGASLASPATRLQRDLGWCAQLEQSAIPMRRKRQELQWCNELRNGKCSNLDECAAYVRGRYEGDFK
jgi:hypothetical protein